MWPTRETIALSPSKTDRSRWLPVPPLTAMPPMKALILMAPQRRHASPTRQGVAVSEDGTIYIADTGNGAVRMLQDGTVSTLLAMDSLGTGPVAPRGLMVKDDVLYIGDVFSRLLIQMPVK